jgi:transposase
MFPRIVKSKKKSGTYEYLVISESVRVKGKGSTTKNIANLGNISRFDSQSVNNLIDGLIKLFNVDKYGLSEEVEIVESLEHGSIIFWRKLWNKLGLSNLIKKEIDIKEPRLKIEVQKYVEMMVINRCVEPLSKLGTTRWIPRTCYKVMNGYPHLDLDVEYFYRSMDYLLRIKDELELALFEKMRNLFSVNVKLTFYDITSSYFHSGSCPISANGVSRDGRRDKKQIVIGVVTSYEGYPIKHYVFEGNKKDEKTVIDVVNDLNSSYHIEETIFVGDRGMITKLNLHTIQEKGFDYIMGVKFRQDEMVGILFKSGDLSDTDYETHRGLKIQEKKIAVKDFLVAKIRIILEDKKIEIKETAFGLLKDRIFALTNDEKNKVRYKDYKSIVIALTGNSETKTAKKIVTLVRKYFGQYEDVMRTVVCLNEERKVVAAKKREAKLSEICKELEELFTPDKTRAKNFDIEKKLNSIFADYKCRYKKFYTIHRTQETNKAIGYSLNEAAMSHEDKLDGIFILTTNRNDLEIKKVVDSYKNLKEVEMLFDDLKHFVDIRPVRHWLEVRVRAHVFLCILALLLKRILEIDYFGGKSLMEPLEEISKSKLIKYKIKLSERETRYQTFLKVTNTNPVQKKYFTMIGIKNPMSLEEFLW